MNHYSVVKKSALSLSLFKPIQFEFNWCTPDRRRTNGLTYVWSVCVCVCVYTSERERENVCVSMLEFFHPQGIHAWKSILLGTTKIIIFYDIYVSGRYVVRGRLHSFIPKKNPSRWGQSYKRDLVLKIDIINYTPLFGF